MSFPHREHLKSGWHSHSLSLLAVLLSFSWLTLTPLTAAPVITGADHYVLPEGETITLTGTGLGAATAAHMLWAPFNFSTPATINPVNDTSLEVVMPDLFRDIGEHLLLVEAPAGSTIAVPSTFIEQTITGSSGNGPPETPIVVRAGGILNGGISGSSIIVETGGVLTNPPRGIIFAENGAVVDFTGVSSLSSTSFFYSPDTVIIGDLPTGITARQLTPIKASYGLGTFTVGYGIDITITGDGTVTASPDQTYYRQNTNVVLTATPGPSSTFSGWSGDENSSTNPLTVRVRSSQLSIGATFSPGWLLNIYDIPGVTVTASPDNPVYPGGTVVNLTATVDAGYQFSGWAGDASGAALTTSVTMDDNLTVLPIVRPVSDANIPLLTSADHYVLPEGETITLTGTGLGTATTAHMLWAPFGHSNTATVNPVNDTTLEVVMPDLFQDIREHLLLIESPAGSTVAIPTTFIEQTAAGSSGTAHPETPIVVRAGGILSGGHSGTPIVVETGGVLTNPSRGIIFAENGAVIDFTGVDSLSNTQFFYSPDTVIIGALPTGITARQLTPIKASHGLGTFTVGYGIDVTVIGDGSVTASPDQTYYRHNTDVTLTATPGPSSTFSGWSGDENSSTNPLTVRVRSSQLSIGATFSLGWLLNIYDIPGVTVTASPDNPVYPGGTVVNLTATVDAGYQFSGWAGDASGATLTTSVTMDDNLTVLPIVRPVSDSNIPQLTGADHYVLPEGETITLTGTGLGTATAAHLLWAPFNHSTPATVNPVNDTTLEVVMPDLFQNIREHLLLVESPAGSTVAIPTTFIEQTAAGSSGTAHPGTPIVVRAGGILNGGHSGTPIMVETGGVLNNPPQGMIFAENGAVIDFTGVDSLSNTQFFYSPDTVIIGTLPTGISARELTPIKASHGLGTFSVGYPLNLSVEGPGTVVVSPEKSFYASNETVTLAATPNQDAFFIRWIGGPANNLAATTYRVRGDREIIARFSTAPDYFSTWRLQHFTVEELADLTISAFDADPDQDSLTNAAEYAFGSDPRTSDGKRKLRVKMKKIDGVRRQFVEYYRPKHALDVAYQILLSTDMLTWNFNGDDTDLVYSVEKSVEDIDEDTELVTVEVFPDTDSPKTIFVKISAVLF